MNCRYLLISPCRNEAQHMRRTLDCVIGQSSLPAKWVIVDDGSSDDTPHILAAYARAHPWIEIVTRSDRGHRAVGPGVIDAFYAGLATVDLAEFEYLCKLDLDLELPLTYFETVVRQMRADPLLGNFSGKAYLRDSDGRLISERLGDENSVGQIKFYRTAAFEAIGGFVRQVSWDGIDGHMCRMKGWIARSEDRPELRFIHLRQMGSSQQSIWTGRLRWGFGKYFMGSALYYVIAVAAYRMFEKPYIIGGLGILWGYIGAMVRRMPRFEDPEFRKFLRRYELRSLLFGKRRVANEYHRQIRRARQTSDRDRPGTLASEGPPRDRLDSRPESMGYAPSRTKRVLCVSSGGGHWVELRRLSPALRGHDVAFVTVHNSYQIEIGLARFYTVRDVTRWDKWRWPLTVAKLALILLRERPDVVISTGALPGYFALRIAKCLGARTIWLDSLANVEEMSMSGQAIGKFADLWLTQWPHLAKPGGPLFRGSVL